MNRLIALLVFCILGATIYGFTMSNAVKRSAADDGSPTRAIQTQKKAVDPKTCFTCHEEVQSLHTGSKHQRLNCVTCHSNLDLHQEDPSTKPITNLEIKTCGNCHKEQYDSFFHVNLESRARVEKATTTSRSPTFDKLMMPHAFTKEHGEPRSHAFMLVDHYIVDRAYGGRFQYKDLKNITKTGKAWDLLLDKEPSSNGQKVFMSQTAIAANPTCLSCKSSDQILKWKYKGDPSPDAVWSRTSDVVQMARDLQQPVGCIHCHDPHGTNPRVVRDALIEAVVDRGEGTYPYDKKKSADVTMTKITFRDFRAIGILNKKDSNLMCAQCHVEYNCNPGHDPKSGAAVTKADPRTNIFPWTNVLDYNKKMEQFSFKDFKHAVTGASLSKIQHPETEVFWGSKHERAGVECKHCHMPVVKKGAKSYTWHGQKSARYMTKETCISCHTYWTEKEAVYQIDAIQNYIRGKMRKAEFWLAEFIDTYQRAKDLGVDDAQLANARTYHDQAHTLWEWWTAENSDGFHNPAQARESLTKSVDAAQEGTKFLENLIAQKKGTK
ncbi:MAG: ammonia-forming cytochrome c nitrite reductase subunit c552 [Ignavibacteria bacterium]|nr:ammonia-forming cytochrome c nitrite reductase subunit c552 [Ignavibacteria bacterium]